MTYWKPEVSLLDVGTRYKHYCELLDLWKSGVELFNNKPWLFTVQTGEHLAIAVDLLENQLDNLSQYRAEIANFKKYIDELPTDPKDIK